MSQRQHYSIFRTFLPSLLAVLVIASMASLDLADWKRRTSRGSETYMNLIADWDSEFLKAADDKGLFIRFQHLRGSAQQEVERVYFRGVYRLYPLPVIVGREGAIINYPREVRLANFQPDDRWLAARGVGNVLVVDGSNGYANPILIHRVDETSPTTARQ